MSLTTVAVVTGASRGLGEALAAELLTSGCAVITLARSHSDKLAAVAQQSGARLKQLQADLTEAASIETAAALVRTAVPRDAQRYLLINNAGTVDPVSLADALLDASAIQRAFNLNVSAAMVMTATFLQTAPAHADRRILNISSGAGRNPTPGWGVYCATKAALDLYSRVLTSEQPGIRVAALAPGVVDTAMQQHIRESDPRNFPDLGRFVQLHERRQLADPTTVASKILLHLASDAYGRETLDDIRNYD